MSQWRILYYMELRIQSVNHIIEVWIQQSNDSPLIKQWKWKKVIENVKITISGFGSISCMETQMNSVYIFGCLNQCNIPKVLAHTSAIYTHTHTAWPFNHKHFVQMDSSIMVWMEVTLFLHPWGWLWLLNSLPICFPFNATQSN